MEEVVETIKEVVGALGALREDLTRLQERVSALEAGNSA
jgi:hypothetical protein